MASAAEAFALSPEDEKALSQDREDESRNPVVDETPAPSLTVEKETPPEIKEEKPEVKSDRPRNPDGTFAKTEEKQEKAPEKTAPKAPEKASETTETSVPHGAFHEERERRKALQRQVEAMEKRWSDLVAKMQTPQVQQPKAPDPNQDFPGHVAHHFNQFATQQQELAKKVEGFEQMTQQQQEEARFIQAYSSAAQQFATTQPEFGNAYKHWLTNRLEELSHAGYSKEEAMQIRNAEERGIVAKAFGDGVNPAERLFAVAKMRGYKSPEPEVKSQPQQDLTRKLEQIEKGQQATPAMSGGAMKPKLTLQSIAQMSDAEFAALDWETTMKALTP